MKDDYKFIFSLILCVAGFFCIVIGMSSQAKKERNTSQIKGQADTIVVYKPMYDTIYIVNASVYHAKEGQCDDTPLITASGAKISDASKAYEHRYIAVSRDLLATFPYGTRVEIIGCGELDGIYRVEDTMNKRYTHQIDILINEDMEIGRWSGVRIRKL
jgi:3D (Asp-Asp-Asp) domain-containing protein